jgi:hypothetical protein
MASDGKIKESHPANTSPPIAAAASSSHVARSAFVVLAALMSASFFIEPFADAAANLGLPCPAFVVTFCPLTMGTGGSGSADWGWWEVTGTVTRERFYCSLHTVAIEL